MTAPRRVVRASVDFFSDLDRQLPAERGDGLPSVGDFQAFELLRIVDRFAEGFDDLLPVVPGSDNVRLLVIEGVLVRAVAAVGRLDDDGSIELVQLDIEL